MCKVKAGGVCTCSEGCPHPSWPTALHLPSAPPGVQSLSELALTHTPIRVSTPITAWCPQQGGRTPGMAAGSQRHRTLPEQMYRLVAAALLINKY